MPEGRYTAGTYNYLLKIHAAGKPKQVTENGNTVMALQDDIGEATTAGWYFNAKENILYIKARTDNTQSGQLIIRY